MSKAFLEFVGFDLGHGESAVTLAKSGSNTEPAVVEMAGNKVTITAVGVEESGRVRIGEGALDHCKEAYIRFKGRDFSNPNTKVPLKLFSKEIISNLIENNKIMGGDNTCFVVGCPSGWSPEDRKAYSDLLEEAGLSHVNIIAESRAAFLHSRESAELQVTENELIGDVLIIDIGSSTTDFTAVSNLRERPIDSGEVNLGAGLIDEALFNELLNNQDNKDQLLEIFNENPVYKIKCELRCRKAKEQYFNLESSGDADPFVSDGLRLPGTKLMFYIDLNTTTMDNALSTPLVTLDHKPWKTSFIDCLKKTKASLTANGIKPKLILMTGGPSRMGFIGKTAREVFPNSHIVVGTEPQYTIAKGLAWAGRLDHKVQKFLKDIEDSTPEIHKIIDHKIEHLTEPVVDLIVDCLSEIMLDEYCQWRDNHIKTLSDIEKNGEKKAATYFKSTAFQQRLAKVVQQWLNDNVLIEIEHITRGICDQHGVPHRALEMRHAGTFNWKEGDLISPTNIIGMDGIGTIVVWVVGFITAILAGGAGTAFIASGPIGWIIGFFIGVFGAALGWDAVTDWVKEQELPSLTRKVFPQRAAMREKMEQKKSELSDNILKTLEQDGATQKIANEVSKSIVQQLKKAAESVVLVIS